MSAQIITNISSIISGLRNDINRLNGRITAVNTVSNSYLSKTLSEIQSLVTNSKLVPGQQYLINAGEVGERGVVLTAISTTQFDPVGVRFMLCPAFYGTGVYLGINWIGVWASNKTVNINDLAIWGGKVWRNLTGNIGTPDYDDFLDEVNWELVPKSNYTVEYVEKIFQCNYDLETEWFVRQWDDKGNIAGTTKVLSELYYGIPTDFASMTDWNMGAQTDGIFERNNAYGIFNNATKEVSQNIITEGVICNNVTASYGYIKSNITTCDIRDNSNPGGVYLNIARGGINDNSNNGIIMANSCMDGIALNSNGGNIQYNANNGQIGSNSNSSDIEFNMNNGNILNCFGTGSIHHNVNNGNIEGELSGNITDTIVNKP